jgi:septum formation protein
LNRQMLVLASTSPRRVGLLNQLGIEFDVVDPGDAENSTSQDPITRVRDHALSKAENVARKYPDRLIVAADTIVVLDGKILEKPNSRDEAKDMLRTLGGRMHRVVSAIALLEKNRNLMDIRTEETIVSMKKLSEEEIEAYVATGEPMDKAGAYAAQGVGAVIIEKVNGCFYNVVGLPLSLLHAMLKKAGLNTLIHCTKT